MGISPCPLRRCSHPSDPGLIISLNLNFLSNFLFFYIYFVNLFWVLVWWVLQKFQHGLLDALFSGLSCVVSVPFYTAFLPLLFWVCEFTLINLCDNLFICIWAFKKIDCIDNSRMGFNDIIL